MITRYITYAAFFLSVFCMIGCEKGDDHYLKYNTSAIKHDGTVYDYLINQPGVYDSLVLVLERLPDLKSYLDDTNNDITFFAINNRSFELALTNLNIVRRNNNLGPLYLEDVDLETLSLLTHRYVFDEKQSVSVFRPFLDGMSMLSIKYGYEMHVQYQVLPSSGLIGGGQQQLTFSDVNESIYLRNWNRTVTSSVDLNATNGIIHSLSPRHEFGFGKLTNLLSGN